MTHVQENILQEHNLLSVFGQVLKSEVQLHADFTLFFFIKSTFREVIIEMKNSIIGRKDKTLIILLAIYNFCFLGTEYFFDDMMATLTYSSNVVNAQNIILGFNFLGVILYPSLCRYLSHKLKKIMSILACTGCIVSVYMIMLHKSYAQVLGAGIVCFVIMGVAGGVICYITNQTISNRKHLAKIIGISYALGIIIQHIYNNCVSADFVKVVVLSVFMIAFVCGMCHIIEAPFEKNVNEPQENREVIPFYDIKPKNINNVVSALVVCVALMAVIFSTLDNAVTLVHASGDYNIGQWARLLLAGSGLIAGFIYDIKGRCFMPLLMFLVTVMSVASIIIIEMGGSFVIGLLVFYVSAGFFVVFFMTSFMDISLKMKNPRLWAGMGRGLNNVCAIFITYFSVYLLEQNNQVFLLIVSLILFVLITCAIIVYYVPYFAAYKKIEETAIREEILKQLPQDVETDKIDAFVKAYGLTEREKEVLVQLLTNRDGVGSMIEQLYMSRSSFYRHIDRMCDKTCTSSRKDFLKCFQDWK